MSNAKAYLRSWPLAGMILCLALGQTAERARAQENTNPAASDPSASDPSASDPSASDPSGWSDARMEEFLLNAKAGVQRDVGVGRSLTRRIALNDGATEHDGHFQTIDESEPRKVLDNGVVLNFVDSYKGNIAAYRLDRLLGMGMVPVSVERSVGRERGAMTWWVDEVQMMMLDYYEKDLDPPNIALWNHQLYHVRLFNELIYNFDANLGNFLITDDWDIVMVDLTRAFKIDETLREPQNLQGIRIDRSVYHALQDLDFETLSEAMGDLLTDRQMRALLLRRDLIIESLNEQIERRGEALVIRG